MTLTLVVLGRVVLEVDVRQSTPPADPPPVQTGAVGFAAELTRDSDHLEVR